MASKAAAATGADVVFTELEVHDLRWPTSKTLDGSDAMHKDPDYSCVYVVLKANGFQHEGHGLTFSLGRGNEVIAKCVESMRHIVLGRNVAEVLSPKGSLRLYRDLSCDGQLRWIGPEKGPIAMATGAIINGVYDMWAKAAGKPLWKLVCDMEPEELVECIDLKYLSDVLTKNEALVMLKEGRNGVTERAAEMERDGYPAYTTSAGWLGYSDEKIRGLCKEYVAQGMQHFKMKVGAALEDDMRRAAIIREEIGDDRKLMMDANQRWDVPEAIENMKALAKFKPWWIEEPTSPDDILGHAAIAKALKPLEIGVATGEVCANKVMFKQLLQSEAISFCQIDSCRVAGIPEIIPILLMAKKFNVPVCPHAGGVGLCEYVRHLSIIDYVAVSKTLEGRVCESTSHLHEYFIDPVVIKGGRYAAPKAAGYATLKQEAIKEFAFTGE